MFAKLNKLAQLKEKKSESNIRHKTTLEVCSGTENPHSFYNSLKSEQNLGREAMLHSPDKLRVTTTGVSSFRKQKKIKLWKKL